MLVSVLPYLVILGLCIALWRQRRGNREAQHSRPATDALQAAYDQLEAAQARWEKEARLLQTTLSSITQGIFMTGEDGRVVAYNQRLCHLLDLPDDLMAGQPTLSDITRFQFERGDFGEDAQLVEERARLHVLSSGGGNMPEVYLRTTRDGRTLEVRTKQLAGAGMVRTFADVTDYLRVERERARSMALLEDTQAMAGVGGWEVDLLTGKEDWTRELYRMLETSPEEYVPMQATSARFVGGGSLPVLQAAFDYLDSRDGPFDVELELVTARGRHIWVHAKLNVTRENGAPVKRHAVLQDITARRQADAALRDSAQRLQLALEGAQLALWDFNLETGRVFLSENWSEMLGGPRESTTLGFDDLAALVPMEDRLLIAQAMAPVLKGSVNDYQVEHRVRRLDGSWLRIVSQGRVVERASDGRVRRAIGTNRDVTAQREAETALRESEERWKLALESTGDGLWDWYVSSGVEIYSPRCKEMYGYSEDEIPNREDAFDGLTHPDDVEAMARARQAHFDGKTPTYVNEHRIRCKDGSWKWILSRGAVISRDANGRPLRMIGTHTDITERKNAESLIWQQANFDALTGLPNRRMLRDRLGQGMIASRRDGSSLAILFIDLDHFKEVNDTLGHDRGDLLLVEAARRIRGCVRESDTVARLGGDEFTVVLSELREPERVEAIAQAIIDALGLPFELGPEQSFVSASIGVALYPGDAAEIEDLFKHADQALYVAKEAGRNCFRYFTPALQEAAQLRMRLAGDLRRALAEHQLEVLYQPVVELASGEVFKAEALVRWQHPARGAVSPHTFIPIAESGGMIVDIGDWVFEQAAQQVLRWRELHHPKFQISVNKSPVQFHQAADSQAEWIARLAELGLPGQSIVVEITEGLLLDGRAEVKAQLMQLRDAGIGVSMDDFGTGYSSLSYLQNYDIDYLKIDQSFVRNLSADSRDLVLCKAIIVMAHALGMKVIAEGVETAEQCQWLSEAGCDFGQGYLFARPMQPEAFEAWMESVQARV